MNPSVTERLRELSGRVSRFVESPWGKRTVSMARYVLTAGIVGFLIVRLTQIGWMSILTSLPTSPFFYLFFLLIYASLPVAEGFVYRMLWPAVRMKSLLLALVKKRVFNRDVLGYSGEVYLAGWARRTTGLRDGDVLRNIRDANILSSVASTAVALSLLAVFLLLGQVNVQGWVDQPLHFVIGAAIGMAILGLVLWPVRRYIFALTFRLAAVVFAIYAFRLLIGQVLQIGQWAVVLPDVPLAIWFTFAAVGLVITRIPFLPSQDLVFAGAGIELARALGLPAAEVAGMLLVASVLDKVLNIIMFGTISWRQRKETLPGAHVAKPQLRVPIDTEYASPER